MQSIARPRIAHGGPRVAPLPRLRPARYTVDPVLHAADALASGAQVAAHGISAFVAIYCGLNWLMYKRAREEEEDDRR